MTLDEVFALKGDNSVFIHQNPPLGTLDVNWSSQIASIPGAFKTAHRGILKHFPSKDNDISDTIPSRRFPWDTPICIKRPYHLVKKKKKAHTPEQELILVLQELKTLLWADALLNFTYINIRRLIHEKGVDPDFPIPTLRYVEAALLMDQRNSGGAFIAEQYIPGDFCKYIDNRSCVPFPDLNSEQMDIAHFLSFVQHFIWSATEGKLLLTDFQGAGEFLTDPQLITPSEWDTDLFSGGNVESALKNFAEEHKCNHFCEYLGLDTVNKTIE